MRHDEPGRQLPQVREYVRVFDAIMQRGINQQEFQANTPIWQMRDVFYGSLEYSARTLVLRAQGLDKSVVENVIGLFNLHRVDADSDKQPPSASIADHDTIIEALARIESKLS
jgi:TetR/AcrR family fatty acid metabolism transcriptional regulator